MCVNLINSYYLLGAGLMTLSYLATLAVQSPTGSQCKTHRMPTYLILPDVF